LRKLLWLTIITAILVVVTACNAYDIVDHLDEGRFRLMKSQSDWTAQTDGTNFQVTYVFKNPETEKVFICQPDPPYVDVQADQRVRIWLGLYVLGPMDIVEAPEVPPVKLVDKGGFLKGHFRLDLPLDEIHPFPRYEYEDKVVLKSKEVVLEIGFFPYNEDHLPPSVILAGKLVQLAPYDWAADTLRYIKFTPKAIEVPIKLPHKLLDKK